MSRTYRYRRKTGEKIKDGDWQFRNIGCKHHGSCDYCENNRLINQKKIEEEWKQTSNLWIGHTSNFLKFKISSQENLKNHIRSVMVTGIDDDGHLRGEFV